MLDMHDIDLRRISALLLCELLYNNHQIKLKMVELLGIFPSKGRVDRIQYRFVWVVFLKTFTNFLRL
jgi:hypothetical protein